MYFNLKWYFCLVNHTVKIHYGFLKGPDAWHTLSQAAVRIKSPAGGTLPLQPRQRPYSGIQSIDILPPVQRRRGIGYEQTQRSGYVRRGHGCAADGLIVTLEHGAEYFYAGRGQE